LDLHEWDTVILYSDALIETQDALGNYINIHALARDLLTNRELLANLEAQKVKEQILAFFSSTRLQNLSDDLTIKVINLNIGTSEV